MCLGIDCKQVKERKERKVVRHRRLFAVGREEIILRMGDARYAPSDADLMLIGLL